MKKVNINMEDVAANVAQKITLKRYKELSEGVYEGCEIEAIRFDNWNNLEIITPDGEDKYLLKIFSRNERNFQQQLNGLVDQLKLETQSETPLEDLEKMLQTCIGKRITVGVLQNNQYTNAYLSERSIEGYVKLQIARRSAETEFIDDRCLE